MDRLTSEVASYLKEMPIFVMWRIILNNTANDFSIILKNILQQQDSFLLENYNEFKESQKKYELNKSSISNMFDYCISARTTYIKIHFDICPLLCVDLERAINIKTIDLKFINLNNYKFNTKKIETLSLNTTNVGPHAIDLIHLLKKSKNINKLKLTNIDTSELKTIDIEHLPLKCLILNAINYYQFLFSRSIIENLTHVEIESYRFNIFTSVLSCIPAPNLKFAKLTIPKNLCNATSIKKKISFLQNVQELEFVFENYQDCLFLFETLVKLKFLKKISFFADGRSKVSGNSVLFHLYGNNYINKTRSALEYCLLKLKTKTCPELSIYYDDLIIKSYNTEIMIHDLIKKL